MSLAELELSPGPVLAAVAASSLPLLDPLVPPPTVVSSPIELALVVPATAVVSPSDSAGISVVVPRPPVLVGQPAKRGTKAKNRRGYRIVRSR